MDCPPAGHPEAPAALGALSQSCFFGILAVCKTLNFRYPIFGFCPKNRTLRQSLPEDVRAPDLVIQTVKPLLLVLLGCAVEGSLQFPDVVCSVGSRAAIGHPKLL